MNDERSRANKGGKQGAGKVVEALAFEGLPHLKLLGRRERRAAETRVRLFRCAMRLFAERGFPNVTVADITEAADVGKGTFFNYFKGKDDILGVLPEIQIGKLREALEEVKTGRRPLRPRLRRLVQSLAEEPGRTPDLARALLSSFLASERVRQSIKVRMSEGRQILAEIFAIGQKRGEIDRKLNKERLALQVQQAFFGTLLFWSLYGESELQEAMEVTFEHVWRAVSPTGRE